MPIVLSGASSAPRNGGTLFLDEIGDVAIEIQPKLLRFLEHHEVHPLGEAHAVKVDVRIIAATNANLEQLVAQGRFREDLLYRLKVLPLHLPPLRERREEIPALLQHYLQKHGDEQKKGPRHAERRDARIPPALLVARQHPSAGQRSTPDHRPGRAGRDRHAVAAVAGDSGLTPHGPQR